MKRFRRVALFVIPLLIEKTMSFVAINTGFGGSLATQLTPIFKEVKFMRCNWKK
jgi:hypothetical protein